jgi:hypothetical protein
MLSPGRSFALSSVHNSGRWRLGSHCPFGSRTEKMRSLARDRSSSRRAPPMAASKLPACSASSSDFVLRSPQHRCVPTLNGWVPSAMASSLVWTISRADRARHLVAELDHLAEFVGGIDVEERKRDRTGVERLLSQAEQDRRVLADGVEHHRPLEFGHHFAEDVNALGLQRPKVIEAGRSNGRVRCQGHCRHTLWDAQKKARVVYPRASIA